MAPFDRAYYGRFYESTKTRVQGEKEVARLASAVIHMAEWLDAPLRTVLDVGAGTGLWRDWLRAKRPAIAYRSIDASSYACRVYGHEERDITTWRANRKFDLVLCQGVLPYLDARGAEAAIANLAAMTKTFFYLEAVTRRDLETICDPKLTDLTMIGRSGRWYYKRLTPLFVPVGLGLWVHRSAQIALYELETLGFVRA